MRYKYDLEERTTNFAEHIVELCSKAGQNLIERTLLTQLLRAGTSIGANYREANGASSKKDFRNKIFICKKEAQETKYWLRLAGKCLLGQNQNIFSLSSECQELVLIFQKIISSCKSIKAEVGN